MRGGLRSPGQALELSIALMTCLLRRGPNRCVLLVPLQVEGSTKIIGVVFRFVPA